MAVIRWVLFDPIENETWTLPFNPSDGGTPAYTKRVTEEPTVAGPPLLFEGPDELKHQEFSGTILDKATFDLWLHWWDKRHQIQVTDDLGRVFWVYLTSFEPKRVRSALYPWKHSFTAKATILSGG